MTKRRVFLSFQYSMDVFRVQQLRNIGALDGKDVIYPNLWEVLKKKSDRAIKQWIDQNLEKKSCVIVLIGQHTSESKWVRYEIQKAQEMRKPIFGIYIHSLKCLKNGKALKGINPLPDNIKVYNPNSLDAYNDIRNNLSSWIEEAIANHYEF